MNPVQNYSNGVELMEERVRINPAFASWTRESINVILSSAQIKRKAAGLNLFEKEDEVIIIVAGQLMVYHLTPKSEELIPMLLGPGELIGISRIITGESGAANIFKAHTDVVTIHIPALLIAETLDQKPILWKDMLSVLLRQNAAYLHALSCQAIGSLRQRVAATLERLSALYGICNEKNSSVRLRVSQLDLAAMLQANRSSVNRELKVIAMSGAILLRHMEIEISDFDVLKSFSFPGNPQIDSLQNL